MDHQQKDETAVAYLATAMNTKLARARAKGRSGWDSPECTQQHLSNLLREHVEKGDPVDVANFCAFLAARGEGIAPRQCLAQIEEPAGAAPAAVVGPAMDPAEADLPDVEDMAHSAVQEALSFGVNHDVFHRWMRAVMDKTVEAMTAAPVAAPALEAPAAPAPAVPDGWRLVPIEFLRGFGTLAHNYSLTAIAPDHYWGNERSAFTDAYARCGQDLAKLRDMLSAEAPPLAAAPQAPAAPSGTDEVTCVCGATWERHGHCDYEMVHAPRKAAPAAPRVVFADWEMEDRDPVEMLDKIYAVYQRSMGKPAPDAEMAEVVELTKDMLLSWWGEHREDIRAAMVAAQDQAAPAAPAVDASGAVPVVLGKKLFQFSCHQDWVNRAQRAWKMAGVRSEDTICLDQKGRVLRKGLEFARADKEGAFPVVVYLALVDDTAAHDAWLAAQAKEGGAA